MAETALSEGASPVGTKRRFGLVLAVVVLALVWYGWRSAASKSASQTSRKAPAIPVAVANAELQDVPVYLTGLGSVAAFNTVTVRTRVDGEIVEVAFKEGQEVHEGDNLVLIDPRPFEVQLAQAQANLARDQAQLEDTRRNLARYQDLFTQGILPQQQLDSQRALVDQFVAACKADQAQIDNAKLQLVYCKVTAPVSGRVGLRLVDRGNVVHASDTNGLVVITQLQPIAVIFTLPEDNLPTVVKQIRTSTLGVDAYARDDQTKIASGTLLTIDNQIDTSTGTAKLKAIFDNKDRSLFPNQFVNVRLLVETRSKQVVVPAAAIQRGPQGTYAYVVKDDKTVEVRPLTVGLVEGAMASVDKGLAAGDTVVIDGQDKLQGGSAVEVRGNKLSATQASSAAAAAP